VAVASLSADEFVIRFLAPREPVHVRGAEGWAWAPEWSLAELVRRFGEHRVPLYDSLFALRGLSTFADYVARYTGRSAAGEPPYLRWYTRQGPQRMPWADAAFAELAELWAMPAWLPRSGYLLPWSGGDATRDPFPAKGLFVCGAGGRTRWHVDPWASDACLCQATGDKRVLVFAPGADHSTPPRLDVLLHPGDCLYLPAGWPHSAVALSDSVSITWNFVHEVHREPFERYLRSGGAADPVVRHFSRPGSC
jgi:hypothetical protein